jgi:hypothetical protein
LALRAVLALSLGLNAFFIYEAHYDTPDVDFYHASKKNAYYIKEREGGDYFIIEHEGHRFTAKCQPALTWLNGITNPGGAMSDSCIYLPGMVGKSIAAGLMRREGDTLVYAAWANDDTVQTADILTIVNDQAIK